VTPYHFGTIQDISDRWARERELERQNERLEAFTGIVDHDLRNPLGVAKGYLKFAQEETDVEELDMVESAIDRMELLVEDLLTLAREGKSVSDVRPTSVQHVADRAWQNVRTAGADLVVDGATHRRSSPRF
jgi:signal transduction histidine kinase